MVRAAPLQTAFNGGEVGRLLESRVDQEKYYSSCSLLENYIPTVQGPVKRRAGTRHAGSVKDSANRTWLGRFEFSIEQAYILEFGHLYLRFWLNHGQLLSGGMPYEIATPYAAADLTDAQGQFTMRFVQSADVLYIAVPGYQPRKLTRLGATNWTLSALDLNGGPFADLNGDDSLQVYSDGTENTVTLTASGSVFTSDHIGALFFIQQNPDLVLGKKTAWEAGVSVTAGQIRRSDGNFYEAQQTGTTGAQKPIHIEGVESDGKVEWLYLHSGYGWGEITAVASGTSATMEVVQKLPDLVVGSANQTPVWAHAAFSEANGWPHDVTFFRERLVFAKDQSLYFSKAGDFENYQTRTGAETLADNAIIITLTSPHINRINWLSPGDVLLVGTAGSEFVVSEITFTEALAPDNITAKEQTAHGSRPIRAVRAGNSTFFIQRSGTKSREIAFEDARQQWIAVDRTRLNNDILKGGAQWLAYQPEPDSIIWIVRADGQLVGFTYNSEDNVHAWHRHIIGGVSDAVGSPAVVEAAEVIPNPTSSGDELWIIVKRWVNGAVQRHVEWIEADFAEGAALSTARYLDAHLIYEGGATQTITGLGHLEGYQVRAVAGGADLGLFTVSGGAVSLGRDVTQVVIGLDYKSKLRTLRWEAGAKDGTAQHKTKRFTRIWFRFIETLGGAAGPADGDVERLEYREGGSDMDTPPPIFTGDHDMPWREGYETDGFVYVETSDPYPMILVSIAPRIDTAPER